MSRTRPPHRVGDGGLRDVAVGFACLGRGLVHVASHPRLFLLGALPGLLASILLFGGVFVLARSSAPLAAWLTPWASAWHPFVADLLRGLVAVLLTIVGALVAVLTFGAVTMTVGAPFFDAISERVDRDCGDLREVPPLTAWQSIRRGAADAVEGLAFSLLVAVVVFAVGLIPVVGQLASPVVGVLTGGWLLSMELLQPSFERRGLRRLKDRRAWARRFLPVALGFGVPVYLCLMVPVLGIVVFPGAVAGATLVTRAIRQEPGLARG